MILCCGEALIDFVPTPDSLAYQPCPGGSVFNIAVGLGRLEAPVSFFSKLSTDYFGDMLINYLTDNGVDTGACLREDDPTTLAFVSLPQGDDDEPPTPVSAPPETLPPSSSAVKTYVFPTFV